MQITGYELVVKRGERAGRVYKYAAGQRTRASRFADRLDREYGAICCTVRPIFAADDATSFRCTPASIAMEHAAEMANITGGA